ncbi:hypothetical protein [Microlunatus sp. Y2014]|uniref:hypothetical protein n=1 Tax=Microlunatus sp. Y2014 TaxID=3418488 RepID=UPI003DA6F201
MSDARPGGPGPAALGSPRVVARGEGLLELAWPGQTQVALAILLVLGCLVGTGALVFQAPPLAAVIVLGVLHVGMLGAAAWFWFRREVRLRFESAGVQLTNSLGSFAVRWDALESVTLSVPQGGPYLVLRSATSFTRSGRRTARVQVPEELVAELAPEVELWTGRPLMIEVGRRLVPFRPDDDRPVRYWGHGQIRDDGSSSDRLPRGDGESSGPSDG